MSRKASQEKSTWTSCSVRKPPDKQNLLLKLSSDTAQGALLRWEIGEPTLTASATK